ncbi:MAG TPA: 2OG-Fe(II) oxygenase [Chloroflexota bacterium]|nr:2OG-Fe(II) oxygenase [Chloroflexota bacterium]
MRRDDAATRRAAAASSAAAGVASTAAPAPSLAARVAALDWAPIGAALDEQGYASLGTLLTPAECAALVAGYDAADAFRSRVVMAPRGYGRGEYKYFAYPLPELVATLRATLYQGLAPIANRWAAALGRPADYPLDHQAYLDRCHAAGQLRPTPLLLKYGTGDYNCLHQDLYGDESFPLQAVFLLSVPGADFAGGELVLTEQRPRLQSRVEVVPLGHGEGVVFAVNQRPVQGTRGVRRVTMRHGVSRLRLGHRFTLGVIFHDAR